MRRSVLAALLFVSVSMRAATIQVEGEHYAKVGGPSKIRVVNRDSASGGKVVSYWEEPGVWLEWEFDVAQAGEYVVSIRYACAHPESFRRVEIDGRLPAKSLERVRFGSTGSWSVHSVATLCDESGRALTMTLAAGKHRIRMTNVDSVGLAVDVIYVHDPGCKFADVALDEAEAARIAGRVWTEPGSAWGFSDRELRIGRVRVTFDGRGLRWAWAADTFFESESTLTASTIRLARTDNILARLQRVGDHYEFYATDGKALYAALASAKPQPQHLPLWPRAYAVGRTFHEPVLWRTQGRVAYVGSGAPVAPATAWVLGSARLTASLPIKPEAGSLAFVGDVRVAAIKVTPPAWSESGLEVKVESKGQMDTLLSSAQDFPALAAFYGYGRFRVDFEWGEGLKRCTLTDLASGQSATLWPH